MHDLSRRQQQIFEYIQLVIHQKGYPPTVREIGEAVGLKSPSTVHAHLEKLEQKGYIRKDPTKPRALEIIQPTKPQNIEVKDSILIPIVGKVTAGQPILAIENIEDHFPVPSTFMDDHNYFMLKIKGESMIQAGILDGDYVLVQQEPTASNGDITVVLLEDEATVKTFYKEKDHIRLQPENPTMEPIIAYDIRILGLVKGVFRKL